MGMVKSKTAMQDLIEWAQEEICERRSYSASKTFEQVIEKAQDLIEKEKEQIMDAYNQGYSDGESDGCIHTTRGDVSQYDDAVNYYRENYDPDWSEIE